MSSKPKLLITIYSEHCANLLNLNYEFLSKKYELNVIFLSKRNKFKGITSAIIPSVILETNDLSEVINIIDKNNYDLILLDSTSNKSDIFNKYIFEYIDGSNTSLYKVDKEDKCRELILNI